MLQKTNLEEKIKEIAGRPWTPLELARAGNRVINLALFDGEYKWHKHTGDELFYIYKGSIIIQFKGRPNLTLQTGDVAVVPDGVEHCPKSLEPSYVIFESRED